jgi:hypothetical protein
MHVAAGFARQPLTLLQALMIYYQWATMIATLPIYWMPGQFDSTGTRISNISDAANGSPLSLDCLFQSWGLWLQLRSPTADPGQMATPIIMRTFIR